MQAPARAMRRSVTEKLLIEGKSRVIDSGAIVAIQDLGASGTHSSSAEMARHAAIVAGHDRQTKVP